MGKRKVDDWMRPFLRHGRKAVILDGGTGTTLVERGADVTSMFWSAQMFFDPNSPVSTDTVYEIHMEFLKAGADVILTNTYKISDELLKHVPEGMSLNEVSARDVFREAVKLASRARDDFQATLPPREPRRLVCLAMGGLGACIPQQVCAGLSHRGNFAVSDEFFYDFWRERLKAALDSGPELLAFETIPDLRETRVISDVLCELKPEIPVWLCWSCKNETDICCGVPITDVIKITNMCPYISSVGVNCTDSLYIGPLLKILQKYSNKSLVVYPNFGRKWDARVGHRRWVGKEHFYHEDALDWTDLGASVIGGCCECNPAYLQKISSSLKPKIRSMSAKRKIVGQHPLDQISLLQHVYAHLSIAEVCLCSCVSKSWNKATKSLKFHPIKRLHMNSFDGNIRGLHAHEWYKTVPISSIPPSRFADIACLVSLISFDQSVYPDHALDSELYSRLKTVVFNAPIAREENIPHPGFIQQLLDKVDIVGLHGIRSISPIFSRFNFSNTKVVDMKKCVPDLMDSQFPNLVALCFWLGTDKLSRIPRTVKGVMVSGVTCRRSLNERHLLPSMTPETMNNVKVLVVDVNSLHGGVSDPMIPVLRSTFEEFVNLDKFILASDRSYDIVPRGVSFEHKGRQKIKAEDLLELAVTY